MWSVSLLLDTLMLKKVEILVYYKVYIQLDFGSPLVILIWSWFQLARSDLVFVLSLGFIPALLID